MVSSASCGRSLQGWPCIGYTRKIMGVEVTATGADLQNVRFRTLNDPVLYSLHVRLDRDEAIEKFAEAAADIVYDGLCAMGVQRPGSIWGKLLDRKSVV